MLLVLGVPGCGDDSPQEVNESSESSGSGSGTTMGATTAPPGSTSNMTTGASSGSADTSTGATTTPATDSGDTTAATAEGSSESTGGGEPTYPPCMPMSDPECARPYMQCYEFSGPDHSVCTAPCGDVSECPEATSGDAEVVCAGQNGDQCVLDCSGGATCPDGMECLDIAEGMFFRCAWPNP